MNADPTVVPLRPADEAAKALAGFTTNTAIPFAELLVRMKANTAADRDTVVTPDEARILFDVLRVLRDGRHR
jgi:hypothetical protein